MNELKEQTEFLIQLQALDFELYKSAKYIKEKPKELNAYKDDVANQELAVDQAEDVVTQLKLKQKEKEMELATKEEGVKKLQAQLYKLKTNKEYAAMQKEIEGVNADNSLLEEDIILILDEIGSAEEQVAKQKELLEGEKKKYSESEREINSEIQKLKEAEGELRCKREEIAAKVNKKLLAQYEHVLKGKDGFAICPVTNETCGGCNMDLPPQVVNEVRMQDQIVKCGNCARILYWPQEK